MRPRPCFTAAVAMLLACTAMPPAQARAQGAQMLYLAEDVPAGLDYDGPSVSVNTSQAGFINMMDTLVDYPLSGTEEGGVRRLDISRDEGRLFAAALTETDPAKRGPMVAQIKQTAQRDLAWVPILETRTQWAPADALHGITWPPAASSPAAARRPGRIAPPPGRTC